MNLGCIMTEIFSVLYNIAREVMYNKGHEEMQGIT